MKVILLRRTRKLTQILRNRQS